MAENLDRRYGLGQTATQAEIDEGLRSHMLKVYNYMASGVLLTGAISMLVFQWVAGDVEAANLLYNSPLHWVIMLSPLAIVFAMSFGANRMSLTMLQALYWTFAVLMGVSLSWIFMVYTGTSIARIFFITAGMFGALSLYGYTTKKDLSGWGTFLFMGVIGILIASIVNIFLQSEMMMFVISVIGVLVFAGLTAYDTQKIKEIYFQGYGQEATAKLSILGALSLYLDFINMFLFLLRLFGSRE